MRELHERTAGDDTHAQTDSRPDTATGHPGDSRRSGIAIIPDAATRIAMALEYRQRYEAAHCEPQPVERDVSDSPPTTTMMERAARMAREVELPGRVRELRDARDVLPNVGRAEIDLRKFADYSLNPGNPKNGGKADGWRAIGYNVDNPQDRREAAQDLSELIRGGLLASGKIGEPRETPFGTRYTVVNGFIGPNGRHATLVTGWRIENQSGLSYPRMLTNWVQPHQKEETPR